MASASRATRSRSPAAAASGPPRSRPTPAALGGPLRLSDTGRVTAGRSVPWRRGATPAAPRSPRGEPDARGRAMGPTPAAAARMSPAEAAACRPAEAGTGFGRGPRGVDVPGGTGGVARVAASAREAVRRLWGVCRGSARAEAAAAAGRRGLGRGPAEDPPRPSAAPSSPATTRTFASGPAASGARVRLPRRAGALRPRYRRPRVTRGDDSDDEDDPDDDESSVKAEDDDCGDTVADGPDDGDAAGARSTPVVLPPAARDRGGGVPAPELKSDGSGGCSMPSWVARDERGIAIHAGAKDRAAMVPRPPAGMRSPVSSWRTTMPHRRLISFAGVVEIKAGRAPCRRTTSDASIRWTIRDTAPMVICASLGRKSAPSRALSSRLGRPCGLGNSRCNLEHYQLTLCVPAGAHISHAARGFSSRVGPVLPFPIQG